MRLALFPACLLAALSLVDCSCAGPAPADECQASTDCAGGALCVVEAEGHRACARACGAEHPCPAGSACLEQDGLYACHEIIGELPLGDACAGDDECRSGACVGDDDAGSVCVAPCTIDDDCQGGERCYVVDQRYVCLEPLEARATGATCTTPRQCASARCVQLLDGEAAVCLDGCVAAEGCSGPRNCVALTTGANVCVDYVPDGTPCDTPILCERGRCVGDDDGDAVCTGPCGDDDTCAAGWACVEDAEGASVCMPLTGEKGAGEICSSARECASGHCARFATDERELGTLCADPCVQSDVDGEQVCEDDALVCWQVSEGPDLCGPFPS